MIGLVLIELLSPKSGVAVTFKFDTERTYTNAARQACETALVARRRAGTSAPGREGVMILVRARARVLAGGTHELAPC